MRSLRVIILAQGQQTRLPNLGTPKQLLRLPACNDQTIIGRTIRQVWWLTRFVTRGLFGGVCTITVVTWDHVRREMVADPVVIEDRDGTKFTLDPEFHELLEPGNSSLKGIARYLEDRYRMRAPIPEQTVVLFGDTVYSWTCLRLLMSASNGDYAFVGTCDLSPSRGELWGVAWRRPYEPFMMERLREALLRHPPFADTYQCGQMRRWLWATMEKPGDPAERAASMHYYSIDDYTRDIDLPEHVTQLEVLSRLAHANDCDNGSDL